MNKWKILLPIILGIVLAMAVMTVGKTAAIAASEQSQISCISRSGEAMKFHVTVQSSLNLSGTTGVLTGTGPTGQFTVALSWLSQQNGYLGYAVLPWGGPYTVTAGTVGYNVTLIPVHNVPLSFMVPQGFNAGAGLCTPTAVKVSSFEAVNAATLSSEDHIPALPTMLMVVGLAVLVSLGAWAFARTKSGS